MQNERQLQEYTKKRAALYDVGFYKMVCAGKTGFPDVLLTCNGKCVFVELKSPAGHGRLSPRQKIMINELTGRGVEVHVVHTPERINTIIKELINPEPE